MAEEDLPSGIHTAHDSGYSSGDILRVQELENENQTLAEKLSNASQQIAEYENGKRVLEARIRQLERIQQRQNALPEEAEDGAQAAAQPARPGVGRSFSFMSPRKPSPVSTSAHREKELEASLIKEQTLRIAAEQKVKDVTAEIEELSENLFQEANEMVAAERKENAELKKKIQELEGKVKDLTSQVGEHVVAGNPAGLRREVVRLGEKVKVLEERDVDRKRRLETIEAASKRVERVKAMLVPP
ncbi:hypothetical protein BAUCODRAFT_424385 [Baudoinia panamericana UAMH 10762]|uniref:GDP/GTP exchange factor Sec2 N-terminal domain-containing protein n=1 Tax=Baudoinia panamericana (strain UAMH 10762) TaxID=717646 RepID=M2NH76_BAUPA|nr:uncharacterized protein BAUCODRAFT_424385 [Baudoinia panamericana UAMH 10762]EMC98380.1 hypothetical protein BAUCODRAFT_424385 [Baudoinia panamericana UAMH 10762]